MPFSSCATTATPTATTTACGWAGASPTTPFPGASPNVQLHDKYSQVKVCTLQGGNAPNAFCTTAAEYSDITGINQHMANAAIWDCGPTRGTWYAFGQTDWK